MTEVIVANRDTVTRINLDKPYVVISVTEPSQTFAKLNMGALDTLCKAAIFIKFEDIDDQSPGFTPITAEQADTIASFIKAYESQVDIFVVNCDAGVSRSSAIAAAILRYTTGDDSYIFNKARYNPNRLVYRYILDRLQGSLKESLGGES